MRLFPTVAFCVLFSSLTTPALAIDQIDLSVGNITRPSSTTPVLNSFHAGLSWDTDYLKSDGAVVERSLRIETSIGHNRTTHASINDVTIAPVLHYEFINFTHRPFLEASIGAAYLSETEWEIHHDVNSRVLFADRIGAGCTFGKSEISLNFLHFSNAGLKRPNPGADMVLIRTSFRL